jgi:hypothetical protein
LRPRFLVAVDRAPERATRDFGLMERSNWQSPPPGRSKRAQLCKGETSGTLAYAGKRLDRSGHAYRLA